MAAFNGEALAFSTPQFGAQHAVGALLIAPASLPPYSLACFDSVGVRHYWSSSTVDTSSAPALGGGATYVTATLVVLARKVT